jgi:DNA-binding NarL/FixJ family response regulator
MIRVEVLESSAVYMCGLAQLLPRDGIEIVGMRNVPYEEMTFSADVYLVDTDALQGLGPEASCYVSKAVQRCKVLLMTPTPDLPEQAYLDAGASGSVSKQSDPNTLVHAIRALARPPRDQFERNIQEQHPKDPVLSAREDQVLQYIARGYTHYQIARRLGISQHTVNTYVKRIREKLDVGNKADLTRAAMLRLFFQFKTDQSPGDMCPLCHSQSVTIHSWGREASFSDVA